MRSKPVTGAHTAVLHRPKLRRGVVRSLVAIALLSCIPPRRAWSEDKCPRMDEEGFLHCDCGDDGVDPWPWVVEADVEQPVQVHLNWFHTKFLDYNQQRFAALSNLSDWAQLAPISGANVERMDVVFDNLYMEVLDQVPFLDTFESIGRDLVDGVRAARLATSARTLQGWIVDQRAFYANRLGGLDWGAYRARESCRAVKSENLDEHFANLNERRRRIDETGIGAETETEVEIRLLGEYLWIFGDFWIIYLRDDDDRLLTPMLDGAEGYGLREASVDLGSSQLNRAVNNAVDDLKRRVGARSLPDFVRDHLGSSMQICFFEQRHNWHSWDEKVKLYCSRADDAGELVVEAEDPGARLKIQRYGEWKDEIQQTRVWD